MVCRQSADLPWLDLLLRLDHPALSFSRPGSQPDSEPFFSLRLPQRFLGPVADASPQEVRSKFFFSLSFILRVCFVSLSGGSHAFVSTSFMMLAPP